MSIFSLSGLVFSLPAGFSFQRFGYRATGLVALACLVVGSGLGSICTSAGPMLMTRFLEGIGVTLIAVIAPALVSLRFGERTRARALGIWSMYYPLASAMIFGIAPYLASHWGWQAAWRAGCLYALATGTLYFLFVRPEPGEEARLAARGRTGAPLGAELRRVVVNRDLWLLGLLYCSFGLVLSSLLTWVPTYLFSVRQQSLAFSSQMAGLVPTLGIVGAPLAGWMLGTFRWTKALVVLPMACLAASGPLTVHIGTGYFPLFVIVVGILAAFIPTGLFVIVGGALHDKRLSGIAMGIVATGFNAGMLSGPILFGYILDHGGGWETAFWTLLPMGLAGAIVGLFARVRGVDEPSSPS
jgi:MFS family permease